MMRYPHTSYTTVTVVKPTDLSAKCSSLNIKLCCKIFAGLFGALLLTSFVLLAMMFYFISRPKWNINVPVRNTREYPSFVDIDPQFRQLQEEIVDTVKNKTPLWKAVLNEHASEVPPEKYRHLDKKQLIDSFIRDHLDSLFLNCTITRQDEITGALSDPRAWAFPTSFDVRQKWGHLCPTLHDIWDQAGCGSCWAIAVSSTIADRACIQSNGTLQPRISPEDLLTCCDECGGCQGALNILQPWIHFMKNGIVTGGHFGSNEGCKPYTFPPVCGSPCLLMQYLEAAEDKRQCSRRCHSGYHREYKEDLITGSAAYHLGLSEHYRILDQVNQFIIHDPDIMSKKSMIPFLPVLTKLTHTPKLPEPMYNATLVEAMIKYEIMERGPLTTCFNLTEDLQHYKFGVYHHVTGRSLYGHCVKVVGWGEQNGTPYWTLANSWGRAWGEYGFFKMLRGVNEQGIEDLLAGGMIRLG